jgi:hypothetical protein
MSRSARRAALLAAVAATGLVAARSDRGRVLTGRAVAALRGPDPDEPLRTDDGVVVRDLTGAPGGLQSRARTAVGVRGPAHVAPPSWEPEVLSRLASWVPDVPSTPLGRVLAYAWAAPMTLGGLLAGIASGARPRPYRGALLFAGARGLPGRFLRRRGFSAFAIGHTIVAVHPEPSEALLAHELVHVRQAERLGGLMAPLYLVLHAVYGYARHPMERAARVAQRRFLGTSR